MVEVKPLQKYSALRKFDAQITEEIIKAKALGLSAAINSAIGYWQVNPTSLNAKILSRYYFLMQMTIAEQVSSTKNVYDLEKIQKHTEYGHGLGTIRDPEKGFPDNYFTFALKSGHFHSYAKFLGVDWKKYAFDKRPREFKEVSEPSQLVNLIDLFRRIPELGKVIEEYTSYPPLVLHVGHSEENMMRENEAVKEHLEKTGEFVLKTPNNSATKTTVIAIHNKSSRFDSEYLEKLNLPLTNLRTAKSIGSSELYFVGDFEHPNSGYWHQYLPIYNSSYAPSSYIVPLWNASSDIVFINYVLLYTLSIIVRYLPDLWNTISNGSLNHIGSLAEYYISIVDHTLPLQMLERITEARISIHQPGSIFGEI